MKDEDFLREIIRTKGICCLSNVIIGKCKICPIENFCRTFMYKKGANTETLLKVAISMYNTYQKK